MAQQPEKTWRHGACSASIFTNEVMMNGRKVPVQKVSIQRTFRDKNGKFSSTSSYGANDLPKLILVAIKAYEHLTSREKEDQE